MIEFDHGFVRPKPEANLIPQHDLAGVFQQEQQELEGLLAETKADTVLAQLSGASIQFKGPEKIPALPPGS
jgi:hypothetical protein